MLFEQVLVKKVDLRLITILAFLVLLILLFFLVFLFVEFSMYKFDCETNKIKMLPHQELRLILPQVANHFRSTPTHRCAVRTPKPRRPSRTPLRIVQFWKISPLALVASMKSMEHKWRWFRRGSLAHSWSFHPECSIVMADVTHDFDLVERVRGIRHERTEEDLCWGRKC